MKKAVILAVLWVTLCGGVTEARAASGVAVIRSFNLEKEDGTLLVTGDTVEISSTGIVSLKLVPTGYAFEYPKGEIAKYTVGIASTLENQGDVHLHYNPGPHYVDPGRVEIVASSNAVIDTIISVQLTTTLDVDEPKETLTHHSNVFYFRLKTVSSPTFNHMFIPKSITLVDEKGDAVTSIYMEAAQTKEFYVEMDDYLEDGNVANDYAMYPVTNFSLASTVESQKETSLTGTSTTPTLLGLDPNLPEMAIPPRIIAKVKITAKNVGGDQSSNYQPTNVDFTYKITFGGQTTNGMPISALLNGGIVQTSPVSVVIFAKDDATGDSKDGGGSCNAPNWGALMLLMLLISFAWTPVALTRTKKNK